MRERKKRERERKREEEREREFSPLTRSTGTHESGDGSSIKLATLFLKDDLFGHGITVT